ncbi:hypothetical protein K8P10_002238 [Leucobacter sp. Psy1]|uniref:hypothetical protein n=1 Tax=Leucobacter sp. Psy1 TaxID=2875729 RepID=UPI001CD626D1|nr:hypothetical protein [Leucobacter sp. Psy1]UBH06727.1 hypothetical protein K8P10_002238 [Leucobacter sp. Psy1]
MSVDADGATLEESQQLGDREGYELASRRYVEFNEFLAKEQEFIHRGDWNLSGVRNEIFPFDGGGMSASQRGMNADNSYCFEATRTTQLKSSIARILEKTEERWQLRGWSVEEYRSEVDGSSRVSAFTDTGAWISIEEATNGVLLAAYSPPYWGEYLPLADDIHERYEAEKARGEHARYDIEEDEHLSLLPGDYRPFPRWDAVE